MIVAGLDRCPGGWAAVAIGMEGGVESGVLSSADEVGLRWPEATVIGVDIPLGLPADGIGRRCDTEARKRLGRRGTSVFPALPAELYQMSHARAVSEARRRYGRGVSIQAHNLGRAVLEARAAADGTWYEVHPEVAFAARNGGPLPPKTTRAGLDARRGILEGLGFRLPRALDEPGRRARLHDVQDAAVCALVAAAIVRGEARHLPADAEPDEEPVIWYWPLTPGL